ncbi:MAG: hypothetical protein JXQ72_10730 [Anaerolineae bacterium]|nr:hypothetical protein [Anaerolineae bacterium]
MSANSVYDLLQRVLKEPTPDDLWHLHPHLLALDSPAAPPARELARMFFCYLSCVRSKLTSKQYSSLAAVLAAGSLSVLAVEDVIEALRSSQQNVLYNMLAGGLAAMLEMFATVQHVKAWETEFMSVHEEAVWGMYTAFWQLSGEMQPDLDTAERHALIDRLLAPARNRDTDGMIRMALLIQLFQWMLAIRIAPLLPLMQPVGAAE